MNLKEENEKLREILRDVRPIVCDNGYYALASRIDNALSQQAEPCDLGQGSISHSWKQAVIDAKEENKN